MPPRPRARQAGLALVTDLSGESFRPFLLHVAKKPKGGVDGIAELTRQQLANICVALEREVMTALSAADADPEAGMEQQTENVEDILLLIHGAALLAFDLLTKSQQPPPQELLNTAAMLHDGVLMSAVDPELAVLHYEMQDAVARLCCAWWERRIPGNELLVARTIPYVLLRTIEGCLERNRASLVHMCYVIREALDLLDFEDETIKDTKRLLLVTAMHPAFLREPEGRRFIAGLFRLEPQMTRELAAIVRNQIPSGQRFALEAYGEILFRAWRDTVGPCAAEVETELQALMQAAILASTPALATALRTVLNGLHSHKNLEKRLNPALVRLYDPILPRAFGAANAAVRRNAIQLLVEAFPIVDPEAPAAENNARLTHQLSLLMDGLTDACPAVREAAVEGCCRCLKYFWEIIPAATSAKIISDITNKLAFDGSSRAVRVAVLRGIRTLLDCQHAQPVLKKALPSISGLLQDSDPAVREALIDLLVAVSTCRGLQFWAVIPPDMLLEAMAEDSVTAVARKISRILVPSLLPNAEEGSARLVALLRSKPDAGVAFCRNVVARFLPEDVAKAASKTSGVPEFTASVPLEQILQLAGDLGTHLVATAPGVGGAAAQSPQSPPSKRAKAGRAKAGGTVAGKKRAKKKNAEPVTEQEEDNEGAGDLTEVGDAGADNGVAAGSTKQQEDEDEDVVLQDTSCETEEAWVAILEGLVVLGQGLCAAVTVYEECGSAAVEDVLPLETISALLKAAEEQVRKPLAVKLVLQLVAHLFYTAGAQAVRDLLFERLADGTLPGLTGSTDGEAMELDGHSGPRGDDVGLLSEMLKTLAIGSNGPKLAALLSSALSVREPLPVRKPVIHIKSGKAVKRNHGHGGVEQPHEDDVDLADLVGLGKLGRGEEDGDEIICMGCKRAHPEDTMLICDGCDVACHTHCLRPALEEVPETEWFCWKCEVQLQAVQLPAAAAGRCVALLLQHEEGRQLLCQHRDFAGMIQAMHQLAMAEADEIVRIAQAGGVEEVDSAPSPSNAGAPDSSVFLLGDPWGSLARYCRAALHRALWAAMPHAHDPQPEAPGAAPTPCRTPASAGRKRRGPRVNAPEAPGSSAAAEEEEGLAVAVAGNDASLAGFMDIVPVIDVAVHTCNQLVQLVLEEPCLPAQLAALQYSLGLLHVLHVLHQTELLNLTPEYVATISILCCAQVALAQAAAVALAAQGGGGGSQQQQAAVAGVLHAVLGIAKQLTVAVRSGEAGEGATAGHAAAGGVTPALPAGRRRGGRGACSSDGGDCAGGEGSDEQQQLSQQLKSRMDAAAVSEGGEDGLEAGEVPPPGVSVDNLATTLTALLCDSAVAVFLKGAVRVGAADLLGELLAATRRAETGGWLDLFCRLTGEALTADPRVAAELEEALRAADDAVEDQNGENENAGAAAPAEAGGNAEALGAVRGVRKRQQGGGKKAGAAAAAAGGVASKAQLAAAAKVSELLQRESPAVGTMATVLIRVCTARKTHGHAMLLLARLAAKALARSAAATRDYPSRARRQRGGADPSADPLDQGVTVDDDEVAAVGASVLLTLCRAECPALESALQQQPAARRKGAQGRCGGLAQKAAAQATRAEAEAAAKALAVLRRAVEEGRTLLPLQQREQQEGEEFVEPRGPGHACCLVRMVVHGLVGGGVVAVR